MAKGKGKAEGATASTETKRTKSKSQSVAELKAMGKRGIVKLLALAGVKIASRNGFEGTTPAKEDGFNPKDKKDIKNAGNRIQSRWVPGSGSLYKMPEDTEFFKELTSLAKSAAPDITAKKYSTSVKAFLNKMYEGTGGGGVKGFSTDHLTGLGDLL